MNEILTPERRDALIDKFTRIAHADVLTNADALSILEVIGQACKRASADIEEGILKAMIEGPTPGSEE